MVTDAEPLINENYERWARLLLGADPWRNPATCMSDVGWQVSGFARVVRAIALRRASLWLRGASDWHASFFLLSQSVEGSWCARSASLLRDWSVLDWPDWHVEVKSYQLYKSYVDSALVTACLPRWLARVQQHRSSIPYYRFDAQPGLVLDVCRHGHLPHDISMMFRSWLRLRCGLLVLSHLDGRRSAARFQLCIFCGSWIRNPMVHCLSKCPHWNSHRDGICLCLGTVESMGCQEFALQCLRSSIPSKTLGLVVKWSSCIDRVEFEYWK